MKQKINTISEKITLLNKTILDSMAEKDKGAIVKNFTENSIKILGADFGFAWWKFSDSDEYKLAYKSPSTPYNPFLPRNKASHYTAIKTRRPLFKSTIKKEDYGSSNITPYMKSFVIIPIYHKQYIYGSITLCYKKQHNFTEEEITLSQAIGHTTAQAITTHRLLKTDALLREEKSKTEFIANATHELRTPLAVMKGNIDLALIDKKNSKLAHQALEAVDIEIDILSNIFKDLALLTSPKNRKNLINPIDINITNLLEKTIKRLETIAAEKNIEIKIETPENPKHQNIFVLGDEEYLNKLFLNLITNAIAYGKNDGSVFIGISKNKDFVKIKIVDDGMGISKEDLPKIFDRFYRADKAHNSYGNHSGLGLAIVKWITEIHGGMIKVQSIHGKGSIFTVTLPISSQLN